MLQVEHPLTENADDLISVRSGTELTSTVSRSPRAPRRTTSASVTVTVPEIFCANTSRARRRSSGATIDVN